MKKSFKSFLFVILFTVFCLLNLELYSQQINYIDYIDSINLLEKDGDFEIALEFLKIHRNTFPDKYFEISKEEIFINEKLLKFEDNFSVFEAGHKKGYFYFIHPALPRFKPYEQFAAFDTVFKTDTKLRENTIKNANTIYEVQLPLNWSKSIIYPLCFIFHGGGSNLERVKKHWHSDKLDSGFIKVYLQSFRHYDSETFGWRTGEKRTDDDIQKIYDELKAKYKIDTTNTIVCGISAGGTCAIDLAFRQIIPVKGFVTFCSGISENIKPDIVKQRNETVRGFIVGGENDHYLPKQKQMTEIFDLANFEYKHHIVKDMEHQYPDNENYYINEALKFITNE